MKRFFPVLIGCMFMLPVLAQQSKADTSKVDTVNGTATIIKDPRIDILGKKMAEYNENLATKLHNAKGYRLMLLSTNDRSQAMQVRSQLLQLFPDQSVYMVFQSPYIKLKFGNFTERSEAEDYRKQITAYKLVPGNIYIVPETVEVKSEKPNPADDK